MYTLYTDKGEDFKCNIGVEGAKISDTKARLVLKNDNLNLLFEGKVLSDGTCVIPIKKLKNILDEGTTGEISLEVIAEDTFFTPWEDEFEVKTNKKITVEVANDTTKSTLKESKIDIKVSIPEKSIYSKVIKSNKTQDKDNKNHGKIISELLSKKGVNIYNLKNNISTINSLVEGYIKKFDVKEPSTTLINQIIENLTQNQNN